MAVRWTPEQTKAIEARKGTLLVSAAAGSGKTAVLVERVIRRITDRENPCGINSLLTVTFTRAAAAQMRDKIAAALAKEMQKDPGDAHLRRQSLLLPTAKICTIDSFCNDLVKENFHALGINPDYKIADEGELDLVGEDAVSTVIEELYKEADPGFIDLVELTFKGRDDSYLASTIRRLYGLACAYPDPEEWLVSLKEAYENAAAPGETPWGERIFDYAEEGALACREQIQNVLTLMEDEPAIMEKYGEAFSLDKEKFTALIEKLRAKDWDGAREFLSDFTLAGLGRLSAKNASALSDFAKDIRKNCLNKIIEGMRELFCCTAEEFEEDIAASAPVVAALIDGVIRYGEEFGRLKAEQNVLDFSDIIHLAIRLLVKKDEAGQLVKTPLACQLSEGFSEILVDEFQDINEVQNMLFTALSKDRSNLFMVGDVKQSIYRFRQAMPEIFLGIRDTLPMYENGNYPARVNLDRNFRSRSGVTQAVNFIFSQLMTPRLGGLSYDEGEALVCGAEYAEHDCPDAEVHLLTADREHTEAQYVARLIRKMIDEGVTVKDGDGERPAGFGDFCILLRSPKNSGGKFIEALKELSIPAYFDTSDGLFDTTEVKFMLNLLRVLNNPVQDIPLTGVMLSPVFGFTPEELAKMRIPDRKVPIYNSLVNYAENDKKSKDFLLKIEELRRLAATLPVDSLIRRLSEETGYLAVVGALPGGSQRRSNLRLLEECAVRYSDGGKAGLPRFINFIDRIIQGSAKEPAARQISENAGVVRIMTVHKSKGLEFPICILADCAKAFNAKDTKENIIVHPRMGIGIKRILPEIMVRHDTVSSKAAILAAGQDNRSEELRVLYVALTRAKERIITVATERSPGSKLKRLAEYICGEGKIPPFFADNCRSFSDWILLAMLRHPDAHVFRELAGAQFVKRIDTPLKIKFICPDIEGEDAAEQTQTVRAPADGALTARLREQLDYRYPYDSLGGVASKLTASGLAHGGIDTEHFAVTQPAFMSEKGLTPAQRGTAFHLFMEHCDYGACGRDISGEIARLVSAGRLTEAEGKALNVSRLQKFFAGDLAKRIMNSDKFFREKQFTVTVPAGELYDLPPVTAGEKILIQGMVDCLFIEGGKAVIVDYKTDKTDRISELAERYSAQLEIYKKAMEQVLGIEVSELILYSFYLGEQIKL
ncbi:MAG: helicase-exonuclease AddAB subunit AddA [Clostridiales bacterium]|nr:helicase-exonuclease AddAB subunit AddA [Clostridiales bacterium]